MADKWYAVRNSDEIYSPALLVYPQRARANLKLMIEMAGGTDRLRPHVKTHKASEIIAMQLDAGITKFKVATFAEAEMVAEAGGSDVLLAYPLVGPSVHRFLQLLEQWPLTTFSTVGDDPRQLERLSEELSDAGASAEVLLEIDNGLHRTGIPPGETALETYRKIAALPGLEPGGLHVYDGHVKEQDFQDRVDRVEADMKLVLEFKNHLEEEGLPVPRIVCGGTPTFPAHALAEDRECSPGTCVYWDAGYAAKFPDLKFQPAAVMLTRVIGKPTDGRLCLDLGTKAVSPDNEPRVQLLDAPDARILVHNEEHLVVETDQAGKFSVGDVRYAVPWHICPTVAVHREVLV
ncbi:MAG: D-TA family PLP-dependent enzyme, partial [Planctomycetales bacterium]